jgi:RNA polymerase sigma-70 factor (ECF subfamily)
LKQSQGSNSTKNAGAAADEAERWVAEHWDAVYALTYRLTASAHDAEDLSQETFLKAIERRSSFQSGSNVRAWLMRIATNAFLDRQRRRKVMKLAPPTDDQSAAREPGSDRTPAPGHAMEAREVHASVERAIAELAETPRLIFVLRSLEEMSFRDIAEALSLTEETARWHMMQARRQLLAKLVGKL